MNRHLSGCVLSLAFFATTVSAQTLTLAPTRVASTAGARAIAVADFDNNGWADIAHANFGANTVTVLLNTGGALAKLGDFPVGAGPFDMAAADFNHDGKADLAVANADANTISILLGRGNGTFTRSDLAAGGNPRGLTIADLNRDGKPDIVYTGYAQQRIQLLYGTGNGTFTSGLWMTTVAARPQGIAAADFNKDGRQDFAVAFATAEGGLGIVTMNATYTSGTVRLAGGQRNLNVVTVADLNKDGWLDVAAASTNGHRMAVFLGSASGMTYAASYPTGVSPRGITAADVNHDGWTDVIVANKESHSVSVFLGQASAPGSFTETEFNAGPGSRAVVSADFNHDGRRDLATGNQDGASATLLLNDTNLPRAAFAFRPGTLPTPAGAFSGVILAADLNHNGKTDLVIDDAVLLEGTVRRDFPVDLSTRAIADFNGDGHLDLLGHGWRGGPIVTSILEGNGQGDFTEAAGFPALRDIGDLDGADMDRDGRPDVVMTGRDVTTGTYYVQVMLHRGDGSWAAPVRSTLVAFAVSMALADLNRDGLTDVITTHFDPRLMSVFLNAGGGRLSAPQHYAAARSGYAVVGDVNEDGSLDVALRDWGAVTFWLGSPAGTLTAGMSYPSSSTEAALVDANQDGHLDLVVPDEWSGAIMHGRGDGTFAEPERFRLPMYEFTIADLNQDGLPDIVGEHDVAFNTRGTDNLPPVLEPLADLAIDYVAQFGEEPYELWADGTDPDMHLLTYEWRRENGDLLCNGPFYCSIRFAPGEYDITVTARDGRGGSATRTMHLTVRPNPELVLSLESWYATFYLAGTWTGVADSTAAGGVRQHDPDRGAAKAQAPAADAQSYVAVDFPADPTQTYKLWVRLKAENNYWGNDSVFLQFSGATDGSGNPVYRMGTTSGLAVNLEACSGCGLSGWGWRDERWGPTLNTAPVLLRFPQGGYQRILIQTREDGVSIDQIVLSAGTYRTSAPGTAKNDTTIVSIR